MEACRFDRELQDAFLLVGLRQEALRSPRRCRRAKTCSVVSLSTAASLASTSPSDDEEITTPLPRSKTSPAIDAEAAGKEYLAKCVVRNTFLDVPTKRPDFVQARRARSEEPVAKADDVACEHTQAGGAAVAQALPTPPANVEKPLRPRRGGAPKPPIAELAPACLNGSKHPGPFTSGDAAQPSEPQEVVGLALPSVGSARHASGECQPCAFLFKPDGCRNGVTCTFCHLCEEGEVKRRRQKRNFALKQCRLAREGVAAKPTGAGEVEEDIYPKDPAFARALKEPASSPHRLEDKWLGVAAVRQSPGQFAAESVCAEGAPLGVAAGRPQGATAEPIKLALADATVVEGACLVDGADGRLMEACKDADLALRCAAMAQFYAMAAQRYMPPFSRAAALSGIGGMPPGLDDISLDALPQMVRAVSAPCGDLEGIPLAVTNNSTAPSPGRTTLMLRNLPNNYTRDMVLDLFDSQGFAGKYDFVYVPTDFATDANLGFAFVNLVSYADACVMKEKLDGFRRWSIPSGKVCNMCWSSADQQGLDANIERYRNSSVMHASVPDRCKPVIFRDGVRANFPHSTKKLWPPSASFGLRARRG
mmetsp:Transcript_29744/g.81468  ORF Transcript_29744/g.81468 Transcript_29744/m.81468 type:complete len:592 (-) Transcript_29744:200-1975(-)